MEILYVTIYLVVITKVYSFDFLQIIQSLPPEFPEAFKNQVLKIYSNNPGVFNETNTKSKVHGLKHLEVKEKKSKALRAGTQNNYQNIVEPIKSAPPVPVQMPQMAMSPPQMAMSPPQMAMSPPQMTMPSMQQIAAPKQLMQQLAEPISQVPMPPMPPVVPMHPFPQMPPMPQMPQMPAIQPVPYPIPIFPQSPIILPMATYYEPVIHNHPRFDKIKEIIKEDEELWEKYQKKWEEYKKNKQDNNSNENHRHKSKDFDISDDTDTDSSDYKRYEHWQYYDDFFQIKKHD